jgi:Flp pilus assembly pilin Flp
LGVFIRAAVLFNLVAMEHVRSFLADESGQDLIEYTLLMAFVALASAALFIGAGKNVKGIWVKTSTQLSAANAAI